ncbi:ATP-binding protein [Streptomyces sp. NPDC053499]|uniref:ATP-binding protein n=1 Tax=Streptomyces sp. NPDC053499 TaxID=3365707 RepID=UPI0037D73FB9
MNPTMAPEPTVSFTRQEINDWRGAPRPATARKLQLSGPTATIAVPRIKRSVSVMRHLTRIWLDHQDITDDDSRSAIQLSVSELMANAVEHTSSMVITSRLHKNPDSVLVEVRDQGGTHSVPRLKPPGSDLDHGRGLALVAEVVRGWGLRLGSTDQSCTVWAVIPFSDAPAQESRVA